MTLKAENLDHHVLGPLTQMAQEDFSPDFFTNLTKYRKALRKATKDFRLETGDNRAILPEGLRRNIMAEYGLDKALTGKNRDTGAKKMHTDSTP